MSVCLYLWCCETKRKNKISSCEYPRGTMNLFSSSLKSITKRGTIGETTSKLDFIYYPRSFLHHHSHPLALCIAPEIHAHHTLILFRLNTYIWRMWNNNNNFWPSIAWYVTYFRCFCFSFRIFTFPYPVPVILILFVPSAIAHSNSPKISSSSYATPGHITPRHAMPRNTIIVQEVD